MVCLLTCNASDHTFDYFAFDDVFVGVSEERHSKLKFSHIINDSIFLNIFFYFTTFCAHDIFSPVGLNEELFHSFERSICDIAIIRSDICVRTDWRIMYVFLYRLGILLQRAFFFPFLLWL